MNNTIKRMQYSGYSKGFRYEIVQCALHAYKMIQTLDQTGVKPMYRPKEWRKEKEGKRRSWYRKGNYSSVIFVPATPESSLKRLLDEDVKKSGLRIRIVEKSGMSVKRVLQRSDPFKKRTCERECCLVCQTGGRGPCDSRGVTYEIKCQTCRQKYVGETARSAFTRGKEHLDGMDRAVSQSDHEIVLKGMKEEISQQRGTIGACWYTNNLPVNRASKTNVDVVDKKVNSKTKCSTREVCVPHGRPIIRPEGAKRIGSNEAFPFGAKNSFQKIMKLVFKSGAWKATIKNRKVPSTYI